MPLIEARNLRKVYLSGDVETVALDDVSFSLEPGEFVAIMGPSGSGKSTLLHILGFLDSYTSGSYFFEDKEVSRYGPTEMARVRNRKMGFVFQAFNLLPRTSVLENVKLPLLYSPIGPSEWDHMAREAISAVGLEHRMNHTPGQLSGGEKQRAAIARALVLKPQIVFADEPTGNLDSRSGKAIMEILQDLNDNRGHTIILITHESSTAEYARRIVQLFDGRVKSDRTVEHRLRAEEGYSK